jgi:hypothetical protein
MAAGNAVIHVSAISVMFGKVGEKMAEVGDWGWQRAYLCCEIWQSPGDRLVEITWPHTQS